MKNFKIKYKVVGLNDFDQVEIIRAADYLEAQRLFREEFPEANIVDIECLYSD